ncbi:MAG: WD40 repeat domain-containing protein [Luteibaculaceae bacterium]
MALHVELVGRMKGHGGGIFDLLWNAVPNTLLSASADGFIAGWDVEKAAASSFSVKVGEPVYSLAYAKKSSLLFAGTGKGHLHIIDLQHKNELKNYELHNRLPIFNICILENIGFFATAGGDGIVHIFELDTLALRLSIPFAKGKIRGMYYTEAYNLLFVAHANGYIYVLETQFFNEVSSFKAHQDSVYHFALYSNKLISAGKDAHLNVWDIENNFSLIESIPAHNFGIYKAVYNPSGTILATASRDKTVKIWENDNLKKPIRLNFDSFKVHRYSANTVCWINDSTLASAGDDKEVYLWKISER